MMKLSKAQRTILRLIASPCDFSATERQLFTSSDMERVLCEQGFIKRYELRSVYDESKIIEIDWRITDKGAQALKDGAE